MKKVKTERDGLALVRQSLGYLSKAMMFQYISVVIYIVGFAFLIGENYGFAFTVFGLSFLIIIAKIVFDIMFIGSVLKK